MPNERAPVVVVVGSANLDLVARVARAPEPGETISGSAFTTGFGGKGANQAVAARRLGAEVWIVARVGDDAHGQSIRDDLQVERVNTTFLRTVGAPTGVASIWVEDDGTNRIVVIPGANDKWSSGDAEEAIAAIPSTDVVLGQLEVPQDVTAAAFAAAKTRGAITILSPAPAAVLLPELVALTDWLVANETEVEALARSFQPRRVTAGAEAAATLSLTDQIGALSAGLPCRLLVTVGSKGALLVASDGSLRHLPAPEVVAVDTTGAGDAFVATFALGLAAGLPELEAVARANVVAADSVTRTGARSVSLVDRGLG